MTSYWRVRGLVPLASALVLLGACTPRGVDRADVPPERTLTTQFPPDTAPVSTDTTVPHSAASSVPGEGKASGTAAAPQPPAPPAGASGAGAAAGANTTAAATFNGSTPGDNQPAAEPTSSSMTDAPGDVTVAPLSRPPAWTDLLGATLIRAETGFELRVRLAGGAAPQRSSDAQHTMNIAAFYDIDGDGGVDVETWANVSSTGWGSAHFDNTTGGGGYQDKSGITVTPEGDAVVLRFPISHLRGAERFRWSIRSEWGTYGELGTPTTARDAMPDGGPPARFPG